MVALKDADGCKRAPSVAGKPEESTTDVMLEGSDGARALASGIRPIGAVGFPVARPTDREGVR